MTAPDALINLPPMSPSWLRAYAQQQREEFHGVSWTWPIRKDDDEDLTRVASVPVRPAWGSTAATERR